jgi:hypothetical protein
MKSSENQDITATPLSLLFLKAIVTGMGIVLVLGFTLVIAMILLGMKYFTDVRSCDKHPSGDIYLQIPKDTILSDIHVDCGIIKARTQNNTKLYGFDSETGKLKFTIHTQ